MKKGLIIYGGWDGHDPEGLARLFKRTLEELNYEVQMATTLEILEDEELLLEMDLIIPIWTMGEITDRQVKSVMKAVESGVGIAGCHGGFCDAFRQCVEWQFMTGGNWVAHPGDNDVEYEVNMRSSSHPLVEGIRDFKIVSEQYYLHVDPAVEVLATTTFPIADGPHVSNGKVDMPVVWIKRWGKGKVYFNALGHRANIFDIPEALELMKRGFRWAGREKGESSHGTC